MMIRLTGTNGTEMHIKRSAIAAVFEASDSDLGEPVTHVATAAGTYTVKEPVAYVLRYFDVD
ncbi:hypothetical protein SD71_11560 [Cohnella kolymensis]|uniref:Uncharacterized protein n=1 Tax=Cohnella kolymensis TaxID=1590652 RepID=A0ABR5A4J0_9BACL|nr:hypothetical protein [Cohnella kolymensis]KIL35969.1 hypothetical protein SD71_11560 [Cohnella kolymensis]